MSLYLIEQELLSMLNEIELAEGEISEDVSKRLEITESQFRDKVEKYCKFIRHLEGQIEFAESEIERIKDYIKPKESTIARLKFSLLEAIKMFGERDNKKDIWRYEVGTFKLNTRSSESVCIFDEDEIDDKFKEISISKLSMEDKIKILDAIGKKEEDLRITVDIPKTPIKQIINSGLIVDGAVLEKNYTLTIK